MYLVLNMYENVKIQNQRGLILASVKTMLLYLGYIDENWNPDIRVDLELAERLRLWLL